MKKLISIILILVSIIPLCACGDKPFSDNPDAISRASNSVVMLTVYNKGNELVATGSGFAAFEDGIIVTNYHVIKDGLSYEANTEDGMYFKIDELVAFDADKDIAFLKTNANTKLNLLNLGKTDVLQKGEKVIAIGSPLGIINTVSDGMYSNRRTENGKEFLQFTAAISPGSSGGALFNDKGEVIGITSASYLEGQNLNLAIPSDTIQNVWDDRDILKPINQDILANNVVITYSVDYVLRHQKEFAESKDFYISGFFYKKDTQDELDEYWLRLQGFPAKECASVVDSINSDTYKISFALSDVEYASEKVHHGAQVLLHCIQFDDYYDTVTIDSIKATNEGPNYSEYIDYSDSSFTIAELLQSADNYVGSLVTVTGYVSSVHRQSGRRCIFIANSLNDVLGVDITDVAMREHNFKTEFDRLANKEVIQFWTSGYDKEYSNYCDMKPGDKITLTGWFHKGAKTKTIYTSQEISEINKSMLEGYRIILPY